MTDFKTEHNLTLAKCIDIYDGDTIFVVMGNIGMKVRLADVNTPERGHDKFQEAKDFTTKKLKGQWVGLANHRQQWDMYGRRLATVHYGYNSREQTFSNNINQELQDAGLAVSDPTKLPKPMLAAHPRGIITDTTRKKRKNVGMDEHSKSVEESS